MQYWLRDLDRFEDETAGRIMFAELSLTNGFGLMYVYRFLNLPYLMLQQAQLRKRFEINAKELDVAKEELDVTGYGSKEQDYDSYCEHMKSRRSGRKSPSLAQQAEEAATSLNKGGSRYA